MSDLASLLPGIAAVITALSGGVIGILALRTGSSREREKAAKGAIDRVLGDDDEDEDDDRREAINELIRLLAERKDEHDG